MFSYLMADCVAVACMLPQTQICLEEEEYSVIYPELSLVMSPRVLFVTHFLFLYVYVLIVHSTSCVDFSLYCMTICI